MVVTVNVKHVFKYPVDLVANTHLTKYPTVKDPFVFKVETIERNIDWAKGVDYKKRIAFCENMIPNIFRKISVLNVDHVLLEEETWLCINSGQMEIKSRNITWAKYAEMTETSKFMSSKENPEWTEFEQHGQVAIKNLGPFGSLLESFAGKYIHYGANKAMKVMEELLQERSATGKQQ